MQFNQKNYEIDLKDFKVKLNTPDKFVILDVREPYEVAALPLKDERVAFAPMSRLAAQGTLALPSAAQDMDQEIIVICQEGARSLSATMWLRQGGWKNVLSMRGGMSAYSYSQSQAPGPGH